MNNFKSFYDWCVEEKHMDYIERWDNELNKKIHKKFLIKVMQNSILNV